LKNVVKFFIKDNFKVSQTLLILQNRQKYKTMKVLGTGIEAFNVIMSEIYKNATSLNFLVLSDIVLHFSPN